MCLTTTQLFPAMTNCYEMSIPVHHPLSKWTLSTRRFPPLRPYHQLDTIDLRMPPHIVRHSLKLQLVEPETPSPKTFKKFKPSDSAILSGRYADLDDPIEEDKPAQEKPVLQIAFASPGKVGRTPSAFKRIESIQCSLTQ